MEQLCLSVWAHRVAQSVSWFKRYPLSPPSSTTLRLSLLVLTLWSYSASAATINVTTNAGLRLQWGPDGYNGGIDNLSFSTALVEPGAVPEPATWAMLIGGFGAIGATMRRRGPRALRIRFI